MSEEKMGSSKPTDPLEMFRGMRDAYLDSMAKAMVKGVNTEGYAEATGAMLNNTLAITAPYREAIEKSMLQVLQQLSLPSRQDVVALAERFTNVEMRLDDLDAKLDRIENQTRAVQVVNQTETTRRTPAKRRAQQVRRAKAEAPAAKKRAAVVKQSSPPKRAAKNAKR